MADIYDVNAAIQKPNQLAAVQQGYAFGTQQRQFREEEQRQNRLRGLAPGILAGDPNAFNEAAAIDPVAATQTQQAGDSQLRRLKGFIDYVDQARSTGNVQAVNAALRQGAPFLSQLTGGKAPPTEWTPDMDAGWEQLKAKVSMLPMDQAQEPAGYRQAHLTAIAAGYQPGTPEYQRAMQVAAGTAPRAIPPGYTTRSYRDANGQEVVELVQIRGEGAGQQMPVGGAPQPESNGDPKADSIISAANAMVRAGIPQPQVEAFMQQAMTAAGLNPQPGGQMPPQAAPQPMPPTANMVGGGPIAPFPGSGRGQTDADRARAAAEQAAAVEAARLRAQLDLAPEQAAADAARAAAISTAEAGAERTEAQRGMSRAYDLYRTASKGLEDALAGTTTNPAIGNLPAWTGSAQTAEGAIAAMAPVLKQLFRQAGEGVFTDKDQALLMQMLPTRQDHPEARRAKLANIDAIVQSKLGVDQNAAAPTQPAPAQGAQYTPGQVININGKRYRVTGGDPNDPDVEEF